MSIDAALQAVCTDEDGVRGAVAADARGLCLGARGAAAAGRGQEISGALAALAARADTLHEGQPAPVVSVVSEQGRLLVQSHGDATIGVFKEPAGGEAK